MGLPESFSEEEIAEFLGISTVTLTKKRCNRQDIPPWKKVGAKVFFPKDAFQRWWDTRQVHAAISYEVPSGSRRKGSAGSKSR